jgi:hypothetical protein
MDDLVSRARAALENAPEMLVCAVANDISDAGQNPQCPGAVLTSDDMTEAVKAARLWGENVVLLPAAARSLVLEMADRIAALEAENARLTQAVAYFREAAECFKGAAEVFQAELAKVQKSHPPEADNA